MSERTTKKTTVRQTAEDKMRAAVAEEVAKQMPRVDVGTQVAIPNTTERKMEAIVELAGAVQHLARALASTSTRVEISNCNFANTRTGVELKTE